MENFNSKYIIYIGDFDFRNDNVQSSLVKNNGHILNTLDYNLVYIGINAKNPCLSKQDELHTVNLENHDRYIELPNTLNVFGFFKYNQISKRIMRIIGEIAESQDLKYIISYQSPTFSPILKTIALWCNNNNVKYIVNSADFPTFYNQSFFRRIFMRINWIYMHHVNRKYADGIIAVSYFLSDYFQKRDRASIIIPPLFDAKRLADSSTKKNEVTSFIYAGTPFRFSGRKVPEKGMKDRIDKIIDLFIELSVAKVSYHLNILGISRDEYIMSVPRHKDQLFDNAQIDFLGKVSHNDSISLIAQSDFSIIYRDDNKMTMAGFSTKVVESVSVGTPVITNSFGDTFLYLEEGFSAYRLTGEKESDIKKLQYVCGLSIESRILMKQNLYDSRIFDTSRYVEKMESFLKKVSD